jgi:hypothetical protein
MADKLRKPHRRTIFTKPVQPVAVQKSREQTKRGGSKIRVGADGLQILPKKGKRKRPGPVKRSPEPRNLQDVKFIENDDASREIELVDKRHVKKALAKLAKATQEPNDILGDESDGRSHDQVLADNQRARVSRYQKRIYQATRDIAPLPLNINWERRLACKKDLKLFNETYMKAVFSLGWSDDQLKCIARVEEVCIEGGMFSLAMPRGGGKTAICRGGITWATAYAHKRFPFFIGSNQTKATQTLDFIKTYWYRSPLLRQDFPEIAWSVWRLENRPHGAMGQLYNGEPTFVEWGSESVRYPSLILPKEVQDYYLQEDEKSLQWVESIHQYVSLSAGVMINTAGIDGSIRGEAEVHPLLLTQPRPDLVLLDDVQKDVKADSPILCERLTTMIDGAVKGLAGPGESIAVLMPCTVIREGDVADTYLDPMKKPQYRGERCGMVISWPPGITNHEITNTTEAGRLWTEYGELRRTSLRKHGDMRLATELYAANREVMDENFVVSWPERYAKTGRNIELSGQQQAMNLRFELPVTFLPEYQNIGRKLNTEGDILITAGQLAEKQVDLNPRELPPDAEFVTAFIDVQDEILIWSIMACSPDFNGIITEYGTWPRIPNRWWTKDQTYSWSLLTNAFFSAYPQHKDKAIINSAGRVRAPLEAKIYFALGQCVSMLMAKNFVRMDEHEKVLKISKLGIDTRWGQASDAIKRYIREAGIRELVPYYGQAFPPTHRQLEEYERRKGWLFETQLNPNVKEDKWCIRPNADGLFYMAADVSRLKDFLFQRLATPLGSPGCIALHKAAVEDHELFCGHICQSEYPEPVAARNMIKNVWTVREGSSFDNDYLDCCTGNIALMGLNGVSLKTVKPLPIQRRKLSHVYQNKRATDERMRKHE